MRAPLRPPGAPLLRDPGDVRVSVSDDSPLGLVGIPWDWSTAGRPGARFAPGKIRSHLYSLRPHIVGISGGRGISVRDLGDVAVVPGDYATTSRRIIEASKEVYTMLRFTVFLGGDHSITRWTVEGLLGEGRSIGLLVLDAHYDLRSTEEGLTSGSWLYDLLTAHRGRVKAVVIGVADFLNPPYLAERAAKLGVHVIPASRVHSDGVGVALEAVDYLRSLGLDAYYLSVDVDHIAEAYAPGVNSPSPLGLEPWVSATIIREAVAKLRPTAVDFVEVVPAHDVGDATSRLTAHLVLYALMEASAWV